VKYIAMLARLQQRRREARAQGACVRAAAPLTSRTNTTSVLTFKWHMPPLLPEPATAARMDMEPSDSMLRRWSTGSARAIVSA
jgi:hypothetical protein